MRDTEPVRVDLLVPYFYAKKSKKTVIIQNDQKGQLAKD
jgi:hypothetical protein